MTSFEKRHEIKSRCLDIIERHRNAGETIVIIEEVYGLLLLVRKRSVIVDIPIDCALGRDAQRVREANFQASDMDNCDYLHVRHASVLTGYLKGVFDGGRE